MYQHRYKETAAEAANSAKDAERRAIARSIELLKAAETRGRNSREAIEALLYLQRLWVFLLEDLSGPGNALPDELKARLISIGLWVLREAENIRLERSDNFKGLIDISEIVSGGLQ